MSATATKTAAKTTTRAPARTAPVPAAPVTRPPVASSDRLRWTIIDALTITKRNLIHIVRVPQLLVFSTIQPVMFVLLFTYVFGGAIRSPGVKYVNFLLPGIFVQIVAFAAMNTGIGLAEDINKGLIDRFRSLPMARSAVLAGRTLADLTRNVFVLLLLYGVGSAIGFRISTGPLQSVAAFGLLLLFGYTMSWIGALIGLTLRDPESVQAAGFVWIFPLIFASGLFVPVQFMPGWLQAFARNQPVSVTGLAVRALLIHGQGSAGSYSLKALLWGAVILGVFIPLSVSRYRRT
jgi:ABC-2 type transport system permease protein/oleandomycin transport system permease protein